MGKAHDEKKNDEPGYDESEIIAPGQEPAEQDWSSICEYLDEEENRYWCYLGWSRPIGFDIVLARDNPGNHDNKAEIREGSIYVIKQGQSYSVRFLNQEGVYKQELIDVEKNQACFELLQNQAFDGKLLEDDEIKRYIYDIVASYMGRTHKTTRQWPLQRKTLAQHHTIFRQQNLSEINLESIRTKINRYQRSSGIIRWFLGWIFRIDFICKQLIYHYGVYGNTDRSTLSGEAEINESILYAPDRINLEQIKVKKMLERGNNRYNLDPNECRRCIKYAKRIRNNDDLSFKERVDELNRYKEQVREELRLYLGDCRVNADLRRLRVVRLAPLFEQIDKLIERLDEDQKKCLDSCEQKVTAIKNYYSELIAIKAKFSEEADNLPRHSLRTVSSYRAWIQKRKIHTNNEILIIRNSYSYQIGYRGLSDKLCKQPLDP